jgi:hypothetical protein
MDVNYLSPVAIPFGVSNYFCIHLDKQPVYYPVGIYSFGNPDSFGNAACND